MPLKNRFVSTLNQLGKSGTPFLFIIDFEGISPQVYPLTGIPAWIRYSLPGDDHHPNLGTGGPDFHFRCKPLPYPVYLTAFKQVMHHLQRGDSYLVNLTFPTPVETDLTLEEIFDYSEAPYRLLVKNRFVVFSPEPFIRIRRGRISSFPMKGTIDATIPGAEEVILADPKESAEHTTMVDLIRNDLSRVADHVKVMRFRYIDRIRTPDREILQVSSEISGDLDENYPMHIGTILDALLPAGSVSGAPKMRTLEIISKNETGPRGYYSGVFGTFDGQNLESAVMIRFIEQTDSGMQYRSGGGITHMSDPESEYREMLQKVYLQITNTK
jgi:para-aminobenzoate synthetase component 1